MRTYDMVGDLEGGADDEQHFEVRAPARCTVRIMYSSFRIEVTFG